MKNYTWLLQEVFWECSCPDVLLLQVSILWTVSLPDQVQLPNQNSGEFPHQEVQLHQLVSVQRVWKYNFPSPMQWIVGCRMILSWLKRESQNCYFVLCVMKEKECCKCVVLGVTIFGEKWLFKKLVWIRISL